MQYQMVIRCYECAKRRQDGRCPIVKRRTYDNGFCAWAKKKHYKEGE